MNQNNDTSAGFYGDGSGQYDLSSFLNDNNIPFDANGGAISSQMQGGASSMRRPARTRFSDHQLQVLQNLFQKNPYPKDDDLETLSRNLNLTQRVIVVWFQNARQKARKQLEQQHQQQNPLPFPMQQQQQHQQHQQQQQAAVAAAAAAAAAMRGSVRASGDASGGEFNSRQQQMQSAAFDQPFSSPKLLGDDLNNNNSSSSSRQRMMQADNGNNNSSSSGSGRPPMFMHGILEQPPVALPQLPPIPPNTAAAIASTAAGLPGASAASLNAAAAATADEQNPVQGADYRRILAVFMDNLNYGIQAGGGSAAVGVGGNLAAGGSSQVEMSQDKDRSMSDEDNIVSNPMNMQLAMPPPRTPNPLKRNYNVISQSPYSSPHSSGQSNNDFHPNNKGLSFFSVTYITLAAIQVDVTKSLLVAGKTNTIV